MPTPRGVSPSTKAAATLAAFSVGVAVWLSLQPHRLGDLERLAGWSRAWLSGADLYTAGSDVDYPPWAIVTLSPLALLPPAALPPVWVLCNLVALIFTARALARTAYRDTSDRRDTAYATLVFLLIAAGALRTLNQFSLLSLALAVAGTSRGAGAAGPLWLGLALLKPQIGGVLWLHALWQRRWRLAASAAVVPLALGAIYAARAHVSIFDLPLSYARAVQQSYLGSGQTEITSILSVLWPQVPLIALSVLVAIAALLPFLRGRSLLGFAFASLLSLRHLSYDLILLLPWLATVRGVALWVATGFLVADPSAIAGVIAPDSWLAHHGDRLAVCGLWLALAVQNKRHKLTQ